MSAEQELLSLKWKLDFDEYDDEDEYDAVFEELYPDIVFEVAKKAAQEGAVTGMHLFGIMLANKASEHNADGENKLSMQTEARNWVSEAANKGCWGAMDDLATEQTELLGVPLENQIAYFKLSGSGGDLGEHLEFLKKNCDIEASQEQLKKGHELYIEILKNLEENSDGEKKSCECIFP